MKLSSKAIGLAIFASPFIFMSPITLAQEDNKSESEQEENIETITVTATRSETPWISTPASITRTQVSEQLPGQRTDAAELLTGIAGLQVDTRYNFAQDTRITLRGFGTRAAFGVRGVRLRLDGIPLSMPDGQAQTSSILLDEPDYVEVLRGPLAAIYGNAAGGVIDFRSLTPETSSFRVDLSGGSAGREKTSLQGTVRSGEQVYQVNYSEFHSNGDRDRGAIDREKWALRAFHLGDNVRVVVRVDDNDAPEIEDPLALTETAWRANPSQVHPRSYQFRTRKSISHQQQSITFEGAQKPWQIAIWNGEREIFQYLPFAGDDLTSSGAVIDLNRSFSGLSAKNTWQIPALESWQLTAGIDLAQQKDVRRGYVNDEGTIGSLRRNETGTVESQDASLISNMTLSNRWFWTAGVRASSMEFKVQDRYITAESPDDSGQADVNEWSWSQGLSYRLNNVTTAFASVGRGFESPTLTEMAYRNQGTGLNTELQPASIEQYELGIKWLTTNLRGQASVFSIQSEDDIVVDQNNDGRTTYRNAAKTERQGLELETRWDISDTWSWEASYTQLDASYAGAVSIAGNRLPGVAEINAFQRITWRPNSFGGIQVQLQQRYRSNVATNDANNEFAPSATVFDLSLSETYHQDQWLIEPWLRVDNLTDKKYVGSVVVNQGNGRSFEPAPGRIWMIGFNARFAPNL